MPKGRGVQNAPGWPIKDNNPQWQQTANIPYPLLGATIDSLRIQSPVTETETASLNPLNPSTIRLDSPEKLTAWLTNAKNT